MTVRVLLGHAAAGFALATFGWLSWQVHSAQSSPEGYAGPWTIGPSPGALNRAAGERLTHGLAVLREGDRPIDERLDRYATELEATDALLTRSLRARPNQARALTRLAAVRYERGNERDVAADLVGLSAELAQRRAGVQLELAELLVQMQRDERAGELLTGVLELEPERAAEVVALLSRRGFTTASILALLPPGPDLLAALAPRFRDEGDLDGYRTLLESRLDPDHPGLLAVYGNVALRTKDAEGLVARLEAAGRRTRVEAEAERLEQLSRGYATLGHAAAALESAEAALALEPRSIARHVALGDVALAAGALADPAAETALARAREAYRAALALIAEEAGSAERRARLYSKIGRTHEIEGRLDLAYDAFKLTLRVDPGESYARRRVAELEAAAGTGRSPGRDDG